MNEDQMYVVVNHGPLLDKVKEYRKTYTEAHEVISEWSRSVGACSYTTYPGVGVVGCRFHDKPTKPSEWTSQRSNGMRRPKKNSDTLKEMEALPVIPSSYQYLRDTFVFDIEYESKEGIPDDEQVSGSYAIVGRRMLEPSITWAGDNFFIIVPDMKKVLAEHVRSYPDTVITNGANTWVMPEGIEKVSQAYVEFIFAKHKLDKENAAEEKAA